MDNKNENFITVLTVTYPYELAVIRGRLESEGIECFVRDELTVQVMPFYSAAVGGIKLQVRESDVKDAVEILKDGGYIINEEAKLPEFYIWLDKITSKIPFFNKINTLLRLGIILFVIFFSVLTINHFATLPTTYERLTENLWCVNNVIYDGKNYKPESLVMLKLSNNCEIMDFRENKELVLPGFQSNDVRGKWVVENKVLKIFATDAFDLVYNGTYTIDFSGTELILSSPSTTLYCREFHFGNPF